jgi:hypothetical protein
LFYQEQPLKLWQDVHCERKEESEIFLVTPVLPEPDRKSLEQIEKEGERLDEELEDIEEKVTEP